MIKKILFVLFLLCLGANAYAEKGVNIFAYSRKVPETAVFDQYGKAVALDSFAGEFVIALFWSKSCVPCLRELPDVSRFVEKTKGTGIRLIMISPAEDWETIADQKALLKKRKAENLEIYVDKNNSLATDFGIFSSTHAVLINEDSQEIGRIRGSLDWDDEDVIEYIYKIKAQN